jgi:PKD repeat protein
VELRRRPHRRRAQPEHVYENAGTYTVALTVAGPNGSSTQDAHGTITANEPPPVAEF